MKQVVVPSSKLLWHMLLLPAEFYAQRHPGELSGRLSANERVADLLSGRLSSAVFNLTSLFAYAAIMWMMNPLLAGWMFAIQLLYGVVIHQGGKVQRTQSTKLGVEMGTLARRHARTDPGHRDPEGVQHGGPGLSSVDRAAQQGARHQGAPGPGADPDQRHSRVLIQALANVLVLVVGAIGVMKGHMSLGTLVAFQGLARNFNAPMLELVGLAGQIQTIRADLVKIADVNRAKRIAEGDPSVVPASSRVELDGVSFGYSPLDTPLIQDFSLQLKPGARVALVGGSGSGKTTVGRMIAGLQQPWSGEIRIGGVNAQTLTQARRSQVIGYVDQEVFLFEGTVRDNLTLWDDTIPQDALISALSDAAILDDVLMRPGQLDARVAEGGLNFSGGQRQRLELARVLSANPSLIVLDEATAALDPVTEKQIDDNLRRRGCGCLIIAHRLSTVRDCDEIVVMSRGRIVERGDHDTLMRLNGEYAGLVRGGA